MLESCETNKHGITVVTSYSGTFLNYQADILRDLGIPVGNITPKDVNGASHIVDRRSVLNRIRRGKIRILYLFMPYLVDSDVIQAMKSAPGGVHRLVITDTSSSSSQVRTLLHLP